MPQFMVTASESGLGPYTEKTETKIEVVPTHLAVDIQGNFHRGLMIGVLIGFALALATIAVSVKVLMWWRG